MEIPSFEEVFKQVKVNLWFSGIPFDAPMARLRYAVLYIILVQMTIEELSFFVVNFSTADLLELTQLAPCTGIGVLSLLKFTSITLSRHKIFDLIKSLEALYLEISQNPAKVTLVKQEILLGKKLTKYYFFLNALLISIYNFSSLIIISYTYIVTKEIVFALPYDIVVPIAVDNWFNWTIVYLHSISSGFICVLYFTTVDALYCIVTSQVSMNFYIISDQIAKLDKNNVDSLRGIVSMHQYILRLAEDLEEIFTAPNLFNLLIGSLQICAIGFNLTTGDWMKIPGSLVFLTSVLIQILMMSIFGEDLIIESRKIGEAAYLSKWYEMDNKSKNTLLLLMLRAHRPSALTAYKFSTISYGSFNKVLSTSWSYFTILRTVYTPDDHKDDKIM